MVPLDISGADVKELSRRLTGSGRPGGMDAKVLRERCNQFSSESVNIWEELACWSKWLSNSQIPWADIRKMMACCLIPLDKEPGDKPVIIEDIIQ